MIAAAKPIARLIPITKKVILSETMGENWFLKYEIAIREIKSGTEEYADNVLAGIEVALEDALKVIRNNRKELK